MISIFRNSLIAAALVASAWMVANAEITVRVDHLNLPIYDEPEAAEPMPTEEV